MTNDHNAGNNRPSRLRKWSVRGAIAVLIIFVLLFIGWRYIAKNWNADQVVRRNVIPQLEAQLGQSVEVGSVETNYLSWVRLHDVTVGSDSKIPGGALFSAKEIDVSLNIPALALGKKDPLSSIRAATIYQPTLYVERDKSGIFNLSKLLSSELSPKTTWTGTIRVRNGTVIYHDAALRDTRKNPLDATLAGIDADIRFDGQKPVAYDVAATKVLLNKNATLPQLKISGTASPKGDWLHGNINAKKLPAALVTDYLLHNKIISANKGQLAGAVGYYWKKHQGIELKGVAQLAHVGGTVDSALISAKLKPLNISDANGAVRFEEHTITLQGLQFRAQNSPLTLNGVVIYGIKKPAFNFTAQSPAFQFTDWEKWLRPVLPQNTNLRGSAGAVSMRVTGTTNLINTSGTFISRQVILQEKQLGTFSAAVLSAGWNGQIQTGKSIQTNLLFNLKGSGTALHNSQGNFKAAGWQGKLQVGNSGNLKGQFQTTGASAKISSGETLQSAKADITLLHQKSTFIQFVGNNSELSSPQLGRLNSGYTWAQAEINNTQLNLQSQLRNYRLYSSKYGNAAGKALQLAVTKQLPLNAKTPWQGKVLLQDADLQQVKLAAISPQLKNHFQNAGQVNGSAQFIWDAKNPQVSGQFQLSRLTVLQDQQKVLLRDIKSTFSYAQNHLLLNQLRAKSPYGDLQGQLSADLKKSNFNFLAQAPQAHFNAREMNPYLASRHIILQGTANGKLWLSATSQNGRAGSPNQPRGALGESALPLHINAKFDLQLPASKVLLQKSTNILATNGHLQGQIKGTFNTQNSWQFETQTALSASSGLLLQNDNTARIGNFRLTANGNINAGKGIIQPELEGTFETAALKIQTSTLGDPAALARVQTKWLWQKNQLEVPRISALYAGGNLDGHLTLGDFDQSSPRVEGEFLARDLQLANLSQWLQKSKPQLLPQANIDGTGFAKAALSGNLDTLKMDLEAQAYKSTFTWNDGGAPKQLPLDKVDFKTQLLLTGRAGSLSQPRGALGESALPFTIPLQELTLWSGGARLAAQGDLQYLPDKSTFAYNIDLSLDGLQLANALQNLPLPQSVADWQKTSDADGVMNARLHLSGEGNNLQVSGGLGLRVVNAYDTTLRDVNADVQAQLADGNPIVHLSNIKGTLAQAPFTADLTLNGATHIWTAKADVTDLPAFELLGFSEDAVQTDNVGRGAIHLSRLPLRGKLTAHFDANGSVNFDEAAPSFRISDGVAKVTSSGLSWHGEDLGALDANFNLTPDLLQIKQATLQSTETKNPRLIRLSGDVPWNSDSAALDTSMQVQNARISFITSILDQTRQIWQRSGNGEIWQQLQKWRDDLPPSTDGNISLNANLSHTLDDPRLAVSDFKVRDASAQAPGSGRQGAMHPLPDVDADGVYENGTLTISKFEARLAAADPKQDALLLHTIGDGTITPHGPINLDLELLHGHLDDLALWISSLRNDDGSSALHGNVSQIALHVEGTTAAPHVIGSFQADGLSYRDYTLNQLRITRFDIQNGGIFIRPGNFTVVKGDYQSSTGWGFLPWSWGDEDTPLGLVRDKAMEVHLPLQDQDFGAFTGLFLPAVTRASAKIFRGSLDITGTLDAPKLDGIATIEGGKMVINDSTAALRGGVTNLSGTLRFENGNTLSIDSTDPLCGELVSASRIDAPKTGNRPKSTFIVLPGGEPFLEGTFQINGKVALDMSALHLAAVRRNLADHRYDLQLMLRGASFINDGVSGLRDINLAMLWKTGDEDPALQQNVRWMMNAKGVNKKGADQGSLLGFGSFALNPLFATNLNQLLEVRSNTFTHAADFAALGLNNSQKLFAALPLDSIEGKTGSIQLTDFGVAVKDVGNGILNGTLNLQNSDSGSLQVAGNIKLSQSELTALPADSETSSEAVWPAAPLLNVRFDLGDNVKFTSSNLQATLGGYLNITGTPYDPLLLGSFDIQNGQAIFPGARARITDGELSVTARRNLLTGQLQTRTDIDATAEGRSGQYLITVHLHGPLDTGQSTSQKLQVDISSDPPMSRDDAFSQLLGISVFNDSDLQNRDQAYTQMVLGALSGPLFSGIENNLAQALGLSSIGLDYQLNQPVGVEFGKAIGNNLYLSYRRSIGKSNTDVLGTPPYEFQLQYRIKGNLQLGLQLDEENNKTVTLSKRWRF